MSQMVHYTYKLLILLVLLKGLPLNTIAQEQVNNGDLRDVIVHTLQNYTDLANSLKADVQPDPARPFISLFRNVRVFVYNDLEADPAEEQVPVRDYVNNLKQTFPDGLQYSINFDKIRIKNLPQEEEDRQMVEVRLRRSISGKKADLDYSRSDKLIFVIACDISDGNYENCRIYNISPQVEHQHDVLAYASPGYNRIFNQELYDDYRFSLPWALSWEAGLEYRFFVKDSWGLGIGINTGKYNHRLQLDRLDPLYGHDPNMEDVNWCGELSYIGLPVFMFYRFAVNKRLAIGVSGGIDAGYRFYEYIGTSARNTHSGNFMEGVISDPSRYQNISEFDIALDAGLLLEYNIANWISLCIGGGFKQGILNLSKENSTEVPYNVYQGQYDPLFYGSNSSSLKQMSYIKTGFILNLCGKGGLKGK